MRKLAVGMAIVSLTLVSACGGDNQPVDTPSAGTETTTAPADGGSDSGAELTTLTAVVGSENDPDAFVITLMDGAGELVTTLPAGDYAIDVSDLSDIHNFHLTGGDIDQSTTVPEITEVTWDVTLTAGDYSYVCDPHPNMTGAFTVT